MPDIVLNFIAGKDVGGGTGEFSDLSDPVTGQVSGRAVIGTAADIDAAVAAARAAFVITRKQTPSQRQQALLQLADAVEFHAEQLAEAEALDTGKPLAMLLNGELPHIVDTLRFFAGAARNLTGLSAGEYLPNLHSWIRREPVGVIGQVTPWNYPLMMAAWKIGAALAAGNTIVIKPAETTPRSTVILARLAAEFLPVGALNVVLGGRDTGAALSVHPDLDMVAITGSTAAGRAVAVSAGKNLARTHLELGGNAPVLVFAEADLPAAAAGIAAAGLYNAGQDCTAATRVLVEDSVYDEFVELLAAEVETRTTGRPSVDNADVGPLNNADQLRRVQGIIDALPAHARVVTGGTRYGETGYFFAPTVIADVRQTDDIVQQEIFGPVLTVQPFAGDEQALDLANGVVQGLSSSVWTSSHSRALRFSADLEFGAVWINNHGALAAEMPHGGYGDSGYGKDLSAFSFEEYTRIKHVMSAL